MHHALCPSPFARCPFFPQPAFLETDHGGIACEHCHGGDPEDDDWQTAHKGVITDPTYPDPTTACSECHEDIVASAVSSLHFTLRPMKQAIEQRTGNENPAALKIIDAAINRHCLTCHASCGQCHVSRSDYAGGGLLAAHRLIKTPSMDTTCASCHGGRVHSEYTGVEDDYEADVHYANEDMTCMDCHKASEMHASAEVPKATTVKPITIGVTPRLRARLEDPFTSHSAPKYNSTNPTKHNVI